ncbi:peptidoglycan-binding domain-containing protein [Paenibacillus chibensis]|uniref:peptidoglycan-binding domain-containing protein n=1 Tax=Paenibacillus chibensis TaxID=59846 RepID=UPI000FD9E39B|nr:peptidoglycan-binding domain-containing protein [Paenibacillus chibensis]MEC0373098.1 peptidoglycan-binding domain-containing protein [Paenibacillus chibensis]
MKRKSVTLLLGALVASLGVASAASAYPAQDFRSFPTVKSGSTGGYVRALQANLWASGYSSTVGNVDGSFGSGTTSAAKSYQSREGLSADGVVGSGTWANMSNYLVYNTEVSFWFQHYSTTYTANYLSTETSMSYSLVYDPTNSVISSGRVY